MLLSERGIVSINFAFQLLYNNEPAEVSQEYIDLLIKKFENKQITLFDEDIKGEMIKVVALVMHEDFLFCIDGYDEDRRVHKGLKSCIALVILANDKPLPMGDILATFGAEKNRGTLWNLFHRTSDGPADNDSEDDVYLYVAMDTKTASVV